MAKKKVVKEKKKSWWQKALCYVFGLFFLIMPILIYISLISYDASDPSFNKASDETATVHNWLGSFGATCADFVLSTFGLTLIIFLIIPIVWGIGLIRYQAFAESKMRIFAWLVGLLCFSAFIDLTCSSFLGGFGLPYNLTGEWSRIISRPLNNYINMFQLPYNKLILESIILFVGILAFNFSAGITFNVWLKYSARLIKGIGAFAVGTYNVAKRLAKIKNFREFKELNPNFLQNKLAGVKNKNRRTRIEPKFDSSQTQILNDEEQTLVTASASVSLPNSRLTIEMPNQNTQVAETTDGNLAFKSSGTKYSPTFDFIKDGDVANQNTRKPSKKISPEDIYQTEGRRTPSEKSAAKTKRAEQTELLSVNNHETPTSELQSQQPAGANYSKPTPIANTYQLPDINLLSTPKDNGNIVVDENILKENATKLEAVLKDFGIRGEIVKVRPGPVVTLYELEPAPGTRTARVIGLSDDIARSMAVASVRMAVVSGRNTIGIELPNEKRQTVWLRELLEDNEFKVNKNILNVTLGKDIGGQHVYADLAKMPHLLVAGTTGSGKSVGVNSMILSLLYRMTPEQCKFIMIDPKQLEFSMYNGIPHLLTPVITDPGKAVVGLKWAVREMEDRYRAMALLNVRNIAGYNQKVADMRATGKEIKKTIQVGFDKDTGRPLYEEQIVDTSPMPYIVIVVDEMADLMLVAGKEVEAAIQRLAQMARAAGIHLIMSTQRPSVDVITGTIKSNFPSRISFHVTTKIDSRTILGEQGAEQLLGMGDMLYMPSGLRPIRVHGCFVADAEVEKIVEFIKSQGEPKYVADVTEGELNSKDSGPVFDKGEMSGESGDDDLYNQAVAIVRADKKASTSYIQRKLRLGYNRAAILIERMEDEGIVTPPDRVGRREVIGVD